MKILVTGYHSAATNALTSRMKVRVSIASYVQALRDLGQDVTWKRVTPNDDPAEYDLIICGIVPTGKIVTIDLYPASLLLGRAAEAKVPVILASDDWQTSLRQTQMQSRNYAERPHRIFSNYFLYDRVYSEWARERGNQEGRSQILEGLRTIADDEYPWIVCTWPWAPKEPYQLSTERRVWTLDPSPYVEYPDFDVPIVKERAWVASALADWSKEFVNLGAEWDIHFYTSAKNLKHEAPNLHKMAKVKQDDLFEIQGQHAGGIIQSYAKKSKPGWWRHQYYTLPKVGTAIWCDPEDIGHLPRDLFAYDIRFMEEMSDKELRDLSFDQGEEVDKWRWSPEQLQDEVAFMVGEVMAGRIDR